MWRVFFACGPLYFFGNSGIAERTAAGTHCQQQKLLRHCLAGYHEGFVRLPPALTRMQICDHGIALPLKQACSRSLNRCSTLHALQTKMAQSMQCSDYEVV